MSSKQIWTNEELIDMLFRRDERALACLYMTHADNLLQYFSIQYKLIQTEILVDIITDSLIKLADNPLKFKPSRSSLNTFLIRDINGDILNTLARTKRAEQKLRFVELSENLGNIKVESDMESHALLSEIRAFFKSALDSDQDVGIAFMIEIEGIKETIQYAHFLRISHLTDSQQRAEVKKHKDRIKKKLQRADWKGFLLKLKHNV